MTGYTRARAFERTFHPAPGVDYGWVVGLARAEYDAVEEAVLRLESKAEVISNHFGGGAGLLAFASATLAATGSVSALVAGSFAPAFAAAVRSVVLAVMARNPADHYGPLDAPGAVEFIDYFRASGDAEPGRTAESFSAARWGMAAARNAEVMTAKAKLLGRAVWYKMLAVALLSLPLAVAVGEKVWPAAVRNGVALVAALRPPAEDHP